jgi:alpha-galactosidase
MAKIALIGGSSIVFAQTFLNDLFQVPSLQGSEVFLMGNTLSKLEKVAAYGQKLLSRNHLDFTLKITTDRREALSKADYVIITIAVGRSVAHFDKEIPLKYGVDQNIGDTMGPGGVFRAARTIPVLLDMAQDMEELCPDALVLNYTNPMAMACLALGRHTSLNFSGMCHGIQTTLGLIAAYTQTSQDDIDFLCAGINHMAWFLEIGVNGQDLYPLLRENIEKPEYYVSDKVRCETMRHFGYMMTESSEHLSEYLPWFRKSPSLLSEYFDRVSFGRFKPEMQSEKAKKLSDNPLDLLALESGEFTPRSREYCSHVIEACETGKPFKFNGNIMNKGWISNLPGDCCVEVPIIADSKGLHPQKVGDLPSPLAALNMTNIICQQLGAEAAVKGDPELLFAAVASDPLTKAVLDLRETRYMTAELLEAQRDVLPRFDEKKLAIHGRIEIPTGIKPVETPIDPAMAIAHRIAKLFN